MMNPQDIINEIHKLPPEQQKEVLEGITRDVHRHVDADADEKYYELQKLLLADGLISGLKPRRGKRIRTFEPIKVVGKPISETIIEDRR
jgi:hypothetical protein